MPKRNESSAVIDGLIKLAIAGTMTMTAIMAPNALQLFDKPVRRYLKKLDGQARRREFKRLLVYMHRQGLVKSGYEHGLEITDKARKRLEKSDLDGLHIEAPKSWDKRWRMI